MSDLVSVMGIFLDHASSRRALNACDSISQLIGCVPDGTCTMTLLMISFDVECCTPGVTLGMTLDLQPGVWIWQFGCTVDQIDSCCFGVSSAIVSDSVDTWDFRLCDAIDWYA